MGWQGRQTNNNAALSPKLLTGDAAPGVQGGAPQPHQGIQRSLNPAERSLAAVLMERMTWTIRTLGTLRRQ